MQTARRTRSSKQIVRTLGQLALGAVIAVWLAVPWQARASIPLTPAPGDEAPFRLPFDGPPGPSTWYVIQFYGNTVSAYRWRWAWYDQGQGLHFGIDFSAPCGTPVVAIGDGVVTKIDAAQHGSGPHNLMIDHPNGYSSFYGHLLEAPQLYIGLEVERGQVVGLSGDPDFTCTSRPHLHLEIRDHTYGYAYNPVPLINADWDTLALFGPYAPFQRDLNNPQRWQYADDQPMVDFGGPLLNDYASPWPPDWYGR